MARAATKMQHLLAQLAGALLVIFALVGVFWHGLSVDVIVRSLASIAERPGGPMTFRFILQPVMAATVAAIDGVHDARTGAPPYFWGLLTGSAPRAERLYDGLIATSRIILLGLAMDVVYQLIMFNSFYPGEAALVAVLLAFVPYLVLRGPFERLARLWGVRPSAVKERQT